MFLIHFQQDFNCHHQRCYLRKILDERDVRRAPTIISYISQGQFSLSWEYLLSSHTHLQPRATQNPSCCHKIPALPKSIAGNFCYCLSLAISRFLSLFLPVYLSVLVFFGVQKACWDCWSMSAEALMKGDQSTGKITADKRVLMKGSGLCAHCLWCRVLSEFFLSVYCHAGEWKLQEEVSRFRRNACAKKWNQFIYNALTLIHRNEEKGGSGTSCRL